MSPAQPGAQARPGQASCPVDLFDPAVRAAPYDAYRRLRETAPICRAPFGAWIVSRHADAAWMLGSGACDHWGQDSSGGGEQQILAQTLALLGPGGPAPLREEIASALGPQRHQALEQDLISLAEQRIAEARRAGGLDVIGGLAEPLTALAVGRILSLDAVAAARLQQSLASPSGAFFASLMRSDGPQPPDLAPGSLAGQMAAAVRFGRREGGETLAARLARAAPDLPDATLTNLLLLLIFASHHNMISFIGNAVNALSEHPRAAMAMAGPPVLPRAAVMELLRFDSPLQFIVTVANRPIERQGQSIAKGETILVGVGAANRDPDAWREPDRIDPGRASGDQLSFGAGFWRCLGARLAVLIAGVALGQLLTKTPSPRRLEAPRWRLDGPFVQRGPARIVIELQS